MSNTNDIFQVDYQPEGMTKWQPIETAPKDGTHVLIYANEVLGNVFEAWWGGRGGWEIAWADEHGCGCCAGDDIRPTHWMPLPAFPELPEGVTE